MSIKERRMQFQIIKNFQALIFEITLSLSPPSIQSLNDYLTELDQEASLSPSPESPLNQYTNHSQNEHHHHNNNNNNNNNNTLPPNFAEAALLLQNSSGVYGRKVEYLHTLVYKTLHSLIEQTNNQFSSNKSCRNRKNNRNSSSNNSNNDSCNKKNRRRSDEDITYFEDYDPELQFLLLDDVLPIDKDGARINLKEKEKCCDNGGDQGVLLNMNTTAMNNNSSLINTTRLSIGGVLDDYSCDGSNRTAVDAANNIGYANTMLRLTNGACHIHPGTGALLMPGTTTTMTPEHSVVANEEKDGCGDNNDVQMNFSMEKGNILPGQGDTREEEKDNDVEADFDNIYENNNDDDDDDDDDDGNGFILNDNDNGENKKDESYLHNQQRSKKEEDATTKLLPPIQDPWDMILDPQDNSKSKIKPMKLGKTIRLPRECSELPSDAVTGSRTKALKSKKRKKSFDALEKFEEEKKDDEEESEWWNKCIATHSYNAAITSVKEEAARRQSQINHSDSDTEIEEESASTIAISTTIHPIPLKGHLFSNEFSYIAREQMMRRAIEQRKKNLKEKISADEKNSMMTGSAAAAITNERFRDMYEGDDENDLEANGGGGLFDLGYGGDADYDDGDDGGDYNDFCGGDGSDNDENGAPCSLENATLQHFDRVFAENNIYGAEDVADKESREHATFEELCRAHLKEFSKGAEKYAVETQLSKRVSDWQLKLADVLAEEEERPEFDIKTYSERILGVAQKGLGKRSADSNKVRDIRFFVRHPFIRKNLT